MAKVRLSAGLGNLLNDATRCELHRSTLRRRKLDDFVFCFARWANVIHISGYFVVFVIFSWNRGTALLTLKGLNHDDDLSGSDGEDKQRNHIGLSGVSGWARDR